MCIRDSTVTMFWDRRTNRQVPKVLLQDGAITRIVERPRLTSCEFLLISARSRGYLLAPARCTITHTTPQITLDRDPRRQTYATYTTSDEYCYYRTAVILLCDHVLGPPPDKQPRTLRLTHGSINAAVFWDRRTPDKHRNNRVTMFWDRRTPDTTTVIIE